MITSYLINLDKDKDRFAFMHANFSRLGLSFERFAAIDERTFSDNAYQQFMLERPRDGKLWLRGQMGCFLSHYHIWQKIAQGSDRFYAVFEDDVHVADDLGHLLSKTDSVPDAVDLIRLDTSTNRVKLRRQPDIVLSQRKLHRVQSTSWCTGGYIIHRRAAQRLLELPTRFHQPVDVLLFNQEESVIAPTFHVLQCYPALCVQDKHRNGAVQFGSNIEGDMEGESSSFQRLMEQLSSIPSCAYQFFYHSISGYKRIRFK